MKTYTQWAESRLDLSKFLQLGDVVDEDLADHCLNVLPPACHKTHLIQIGEPHDHINGRATFATIEKTRDGWTWRGHCHRGQTVEPEWTAENLAKIAAAEAHWNAYYSCLEAAKQGVL